MAAFRVGTLTASDGVLKRPFGYVLLTTYIVVTVVSYLLSWPVVPTRVSVYC